MKVVSLTGYTHCFCCTFFISLIQLTKISVAGFFEALCLKISFIELNFNKEILDQGRTTFNRVYWYINLCLWFHCKWISFWPQIIVPLPAVDHYEVCFTSFYSKMIGKLHCISEYCMPLGAIQYRHSTCACTLVTMF